MVKKDDATMDGGLPTDIVIPVMGPTGVGKSTFINSLLGQEKMVVGHDLKSCTARIEHAVVSNIPSHPNLHGRRVVIVDVPGFDDTIEDDAEILRRIAIWLASSYDDGMKLGGVIYLHEISQTRMLGTTRRNLNMFRKLCGEEALSRVILGTTKWADVLSDIGEQREKQLSDKFWKEMIGFGSVVRRFDKTQESAQAILNVILDKLTPPTPGESTPGSVGHDPTLQIQKELVHLQRFIPETQAGQELRYTLQQLLEMQKKMARELEVGNSEGSDHQARAKMKETQDNIKKTVKQIKDLKVPLPRRILAFFRLT